MSHTIKLADYLFTRLRQLGVESIHGVPGDYNLALLDYVEPQGIHWVGNCNELNAGYAADGYSRVKGIGALITTFGVGELSATNAIAGAYTELAPVVHIVGTPARHLQEDRALIHHTFCDGEYGRFAQMHSHITVSQANLLDPRLVPQQIDTVLRDCLLHSRPVYIQVPADMVGVPVVADRLESRVSVRNVISAPQEAAGIKLVLDRMYSSKQPMILVDGESRGYDILEQLHDLVKTTGWPTWTTIFGKSCVDESLPNVHGIWKGNEASKAEADYIKSCDLILCFGPHFSNTNTYAYSSVPDANVSIFFHQTSLKEGSRSLRDLPSRHFLSVLMKKLDVSKLCRAPAPAVTNGSQSTLAPPDGVITQNLFYHTFSKNLRPGDIILGETGTAGHGCRDFKLPSHTHLFKPSTWLSIGYMLPAAQGAALAQRELHALGKWPTEPRTVLLIGDGSFQMTVQELGTIIKEKLNVLLILINNDGYTIERCLHGWNQRYNDIAFWRYLEAPSFFGASDKKEAGYHYQTWRVETWQELHEMLKEERSTQEPAFRMCEVRMDWEDAPATLSKLLLQQKVAPKPKDADEVH